MTTTSSRQNRIVMENPLTLMTQNEAEAISKDLLSRISSHTRATVRLFQGVTASTSFSNNEVADMQSVASIGIELSVNIDNKLARGTTTQLDPQGLDDLVHTTEEAANSGRKDTMESMGSMAPPQEFTDPPIYFDTSIKAAESQYQGDLIRGTAAQARKAGLVGAGEILAATSSTTVLNSLGFKGFSRDTYAQYSMTARTSGGKGSGWAWGGGEDFSKLDPTAITAKAIDLCHKSDNPVAVEPGRYTVILEPEAMAQIMDTVINTPTQFIAALAADEGASVFSRKEGGNKIGLKMTDERVQIYYDPNDPVLPFNPMHFNGAILPRTHWIENGVLVNLATWNYYGKKMHPPRGDVVNPQKGKLEITGPTQSLDEMIASTKRGILVHQFAGISKTNSRTLLLTGVTRNGTFLIENGKITKAIKNLRFSESPFFILNKLDAFGPSVRSDRVWATPRVKVHDFEFTSLSDAV